MATNHTSNYELCQWEATDQVLRTDFNEDNVKVDAALAGLAKVDQQHEAKMAQLNQQLNLRGNCQLYATPYVGTGEEYASITFPHKPIFLCIMDPNDYYSVIAPYGVNQVLSRTVSYYGEVTLQWSGNTVTWSSTGHSDFQCNEKGKSYPVLALLDLNQ